MPPKKPKPQTLSQSEFITEVAKSQNVHKIEVYNAIKLIKLGAADVLKQCKSFRLHEFATFNISEVKGREVRNPRTGDKSNIPAYIGLRIKPSRKIKDAVKEAKQTATLTNKKSK